MDELAFIHDNPCEFDCLFWLTWQLPHLPCAKYVLCVVAKVFCECPPCPLTDVCVFCVSLSFVSM